MNKTPPSPQLIEAAPDLLETIEVLLAEMNKNGNCMYDRLRDDCQAAVDKAKGKDVGQVRFPTPSRQSQPCGECHLQPGERCDICGAKQR